MAAGICLAWLEAKMLVFRLKSKLDGAYIQDTPGSQIGFTNLNSIQVGSICGIEVPQKILIPIENNAAMPSRYGFAIEYDFVVSPRADMDDRLLEGVFNRFFTRYITDELAFPESQITQPLILR